MREKLAVYGQWTYRGAWALEITAAIIGLLTGLVLGYRGSMASEQVTSMDLALASAPFFMVAIAELTKIPIATLLYSASWLWKPVLALFLAVLALITFETVFMGLERAVTLRQLQYEQLTEKIGGLGFERSNIERTIQQLQATDQAQIAQADIEKTNQLARLETEAVQGEISEVVKALQGQVMLTPEAANIRQSIVDRETQLQALNAERRAELEQKVGAFERQRESYLVRIRDLAAAGLPTERWEDELARLRNPVRAIEQRYAEKIGSLENDITTLRKQLDEVQAKGTLQTEADRTALEKQRTELLAKLSKTNEKWGEAKDAARKSLEVARTAEATESTTIAAYRHRLDQITNELSPIETERIKNARLDQVRRIAGRFYGLDPENVTVEKANVVALVWFGSLATLAALAGPLTAMVALGLQRLPETDQRQESKLAVMPEGGCSDGVTAG